MNTINVCIGHVPFPDSHAQFVDLTISPNVLSGASGRRAIVPDELYGENGHSLSEYAQLLWLYKHIDAIAPGFEYVNILHYRRFVSVRPVDGTKASNGPWITVIQEDELDQYAHCFDRNNTNSCFNTKVFFSDGVVTQYAAQHVLEDFLNFVKYLVEIEMFTPLDAAKFLRYQDIVPACSVGIYRIDIFKKLYSYLERAAEFRSSSYFVPRESYQRRSMGFLLERLHSFLILELLSSMGAFGQNMMISESGAVSSTTERVG